MSGREKFPSEAAERFQIRLPDGMRDRIRDAAEASGRSMNAEIIARLEQAYVSWPKVRVPPELLRRIEDAATPEDMGILEENISRSVLRHLQKLFPEKSRFELAEETIDGLIEAAPESERADLQRDFDNLLERLKASLYKDLPF